MAHKTLVGGTAYNITGGKTMIDGAIYDIKKGRTLVDGTGYDINFAPEPIAMLYSSGNFIFQIDNSVIDGETLVNSYAGWESVSYKNASAVPWHSSRNNIINVSFQNEIAPISLSYWFDNARKMKNFNINGLNLNYVTNMYSTYKRCSNLTGSPVCGDNVTNMDDTYSECLNLTGSPVCGEKVTSMTGTYFRCHKLTGSPVCGDNVTSMWGTYSNCTRLTGSPVCGDKVTYMYQTYDNCVCLTGSPVCGDKVTDMISTYSNCFNLTGSPVCGDKVTDMFSTYSNCFNLTGSPVCGDKVTGMISTYYNCFNLTGSPVCGDKVTNMYYAYFNCSNLTGNAYFYSSSVSNVKYCFGDKNNLKQLNIYVPSGSTTEATVLINNTSSLVGANITYTNAGTYHYNTAYNIYIYPISNVAAARAANGD